MKNDKTCYGLIWPLKLKVASALSTVLVLCAACCADLPFIPTPAPTITPSPTPEPKVLTVCLLDEPDSLYLYGTDSVATHHVWQAIYDGPLDNRTYTYQPVILTGLPNLADSADPAGPRAVVETVTVGAGERVLAAAGEVIALSPGATVEVDGGQRVAFDGTPVQMQRMVVTFTLQPGLVWSDGAPLTADDSVFSFELAADPATPLGDKTIVERTAEYRAEDAHTVVWSGIPGYLDHFYYLNFWHPLPRHAWGHLSAAELLTADISTRQPLGWGAFEVREWVSGDHITVVRNPAYFRAPGGLPRLDEVVYRFIPDPIALAQELVVGRCDVVTHDAAGAVQAALPDLPAEIQELSVPGARWELLAFGISPNRDYERPDFFEDVRVRQGVALCIDRQALAEQAVGTSGRVLDSYVPPEHPLYASGLTTWAYDPAAGQALLAGAGWYDEDGNGVREAHSIPGIADGTPFQVTYQTTDDPLRMQTAQSIQTYLAGCGVQISVEIAAPDAFFAPGPAGPLFGRRFDLAQFSWRTAAEPLCDLFLSGQMPDGDRWDRPNVVGFLDDEYDEACLSALEALPGGGEYIDGQTAAYAEAQRIFSERLPVLPLFQRPKVTFARTSVIGLAPNPTQVSELWNIEQLDLRP
jgi:peptide/nickel transport system substrate-binding protein